MSLTPPSSPSGELIAVRFRAARVALALVATVILLAGCGGSNVGVAAKVNGQQISETRLSSYVTPKAKPITLSGQVTPPKPFVLYILVREQLYSALLRKTGGMPSAGQISSLVSSYIGNGTAQQSVESLGVYGYTPSFAQEILRYRALGSILDQRVRSGVDVATAARNLQFSVVINPRYGKWDHKTMTILTAPSAGLPDYLQLQPTVGANPAAG
jgi:hypothetical protein